MSMIVRSNFVETYGDFQEKHSSQHIHFPCKMFCEQDNTFLNDKNTFSIFFLLQNISNTKYFGP